MKNYIVVYNDLGCQLKSIEVKNPDNQKEVKRALNKIAEDYLEVGDTIKFIQEQ